MSENLSRGSDTLVFSYFYAEPSGFWIEGQFLQSHQISDLINYLLLIFNFTGPSGLYNNAYWSLPVEFQYYLIFPLLILSLRVFGLLGPVAIGLALYIVPRLEIINVESYSFFSLAFSFCGGVIAGHLHKTLYWRMNFRSGIAIFIILLSLVSAVRHSVIPLPDLFFISNKWNVYGLIGIATVIVVLFTRVNNEGKIQSFLKHYGTISYSTYLYHNLFVALSVLVIINFQIFDAGYRLIITFLLTVMATYLAAILSYKYVETPAIAIGRGLAGRSSTQIETGTWIEDGARPLRSVARHKTK